MGDIALYLLMGFAIMATLQYANYLRSRFAVATVYSRLAKEWNGSYEAGSFFNPPLVRYERDGNKAELSSFYLYRGKTGNYTQFRFQLGKSYLQAFSVTDGSAGTAEYHIDSVRPELVQKLVTAEWAGELERIAAMSGGRGLEIRFDGDTLIVRKRGLLLETENLSIFKEACENILGHLHTALGQPIGAPRQVDPNCQV